MLKPPIAIQEEHTASVFIQGGTQPRDMDHGHHHSKSRNEGSITHSLDSDAASRRRRERRSPSPPTRKRSPTYPPPNDANMGDHKDKKRRRKRIPNPPTSSSNSSSPHAKISFDESSDSYESKHLRRSKRKNYPMWKKAHKMRKFKEGGKNITFLTYDGTYGATDQVLSFIQQYDAAFGNEDFSESSKMRHVSMHLKKKNRLDNVGQAYAPKERHQRLGKQ